MGYQAETFQGLHHVQLGIRRAVRTAVGSSGDRSWGSLSWRSPRHLRRAVGAGSGVAPSRSISGSRPHFRPAGKAHPGILVADLDSVAERLELHGVEVKWDEDFPGMRRFYAADPFGNRLELLEPLS